jgi:peptide/nickel transport system permease protein
MGERGAPAALVGHGSGRGGSSAARGPAGAAWRRFRRDPAAMTGAVLLALFYALALLAPFVAPYAEDDMDRERFYHPPQALRWCDRDGRLTLRPRVAPTIAGPGVFAYRPDPASAVPLRFLVRGARYRVLGGLESDLHLFGVDAPGRVHLLGTDPAGRDEFSRLLFGARVSLTVGLVGILVSFALGLLLGGIAGYAGGWVDGLIMRGSEVMLSVPALYLVIALRSAFPAALPGGQVYLAIVAILALIGWAGLARVIRGMVLSIRRTDYVAAAEALGVGRFRVLVRHVLPNTLSFVIVAATVAVPGYILGEVFLSFLGVGVQEPAASWGNMLQQARSLTVLTDFPWLLYAPGMAVFVTVMAFNFLGDGLRDALDPRAPSGPPR